MGEDKRATWAFIAFVGLLGSILCALASQFDPPLGRPFEINWVFLAVGFALTERYSVNLEVRRDAHSLTFSEIPLTIGLIFTDPSGLILARVVGAAVGHAIVRRPRFIKYVFNVGQFALDVGTAVLVFHLILGAANPIDPRGWVAGLLAIACAHLAGWLAVSTVMRLAGAPVTLPAAFKVLAVSGTAALAECAVALGGAAALWRDGRSWVLLLIIGSGLAYFFLSFVRIRERHQALATLHGFTTSLDSNDLDGLIAQSLRGIADLLQAGRVMILIPEGDAVRHFEHDGSGLRERRIASGSSNLDLMATLGQAGRSTVSNQSHLPLQEIASGGAIVAPLQMQDAEGLVIAADRMSDARGFDDEDIQLLETAAGHAGSAVHRTQLVNRLREEADFRAHQALHDDVTDLPNQRALIEQLDGQLSDGVDLAMVTVRVNSLREVNETLGRAIGDEMLRQVAARLRPVGRRAWCARSANDEFTLIVPGGQKEADDFSDRIVEAFDLPVLCGEVALAVIVGIGVALSPVHGVDSETLLRRASLAASRTALDGTTVTTWASDRDPYDPQRLTIAADLRDAIPSGELEVHFQPQFDVVNGLVTGAEALVRWEHPRLGMLRPDQFIEAAENTGAIDALTLHVLTVAAVTGVRWRERGWDLDMAVNLSARNLTNPNFAADVAVILERTGLPPGSLTMELTESSVMTEAERALRTLHELDELGIAISIDDFGTGYSSLAHLRRLPVGEIKIDKSFVLDLTTSESDEAIVRSMIELGHNLGLTVVVEGVETVEVRDRLYELGTDRLQGYLLSRPLPAEAFEHWVSERPFRTVADSPKDRVVQLQRRLRG
ncbi:MAG: bifunctional diguanylate cyclase/phosphodiesterase [Acidimicrobiales bacterium]|nr:bifunctional diguanylate cyclase/phosphodiesterase [Acidimicrobiales bacterium]